MSEQKTERKNNTVATVLDDDHKELVTRTARVYGTTASEIVRRAVEAYFENRSDIVAMVSDMPELPVL
nr:MAG TPA: repressor [Caudoviricetes sp.]